MHVRELSVPGVWEFTPQHHSDSRGDFCELFTDPGFRGVTGHRLDVAQVNMSVSGEGVLRGLHFAQVPPGQAKYVTCPAGTVYDVVVDVRLGSPTFGEWGGAILDGQDHRALYIPEGVAHGFLALEPQSTVLYMCSEGYRPGVEHAVDPLDPRIGIDWPAVALDGTAIEYVRSERDVASPSLADVAAAGLLPRWEACVRHVQDLRDRTPRYDALWRPSGSVVVDGPDAL